MKSYCNKLVEEAAEIIREKRKIKVMNVDYYRAIINGYSKLGYYLSTKKKENVHILALECYSLKQICFELYNYLDENKEPKENTIGRRIKRTAPEIIEIFKEKYNSGEIDIEAELDLGEEFRLNISENVS